MSFAAAFPNITAILMGVIYVLKIKNKEIVPTIEPYLKPLVIFLIYVILSLFIFSCLENILNRQLGVYIFAFLLVTSKALSNKQLNE